MRNQSGDSAAHLFGFIFYVHCSYSMLMLCVQPRTLSSLVPTVMEVDEGPTQENDSLPMPTGPIP